MLIVVYYKLKRRWNRLYYRLVTELFYKLFFIKCGRGVAIRKPIFITPQYIEIGDCVSIWPGARIEGVDEYETMKYTPKIKIGNNVSIQQNIHLTCADTVIIGENTAIAANVSITDINHPYYDIGLPPEKHMLEVKPVIIGKDCKIYNNAVVLPGTILGKHCVVGANSVISGEFPEYSVIVGAPARIVKRFNLVENKWEIVNF